MSLRIVVADQSEARFYDLGVPTAPLTPAGSLQHPIARLHDHDLVSDRPGRVAPRTGGGTIHSATDGERSPHTHEAEVFARHVTQELERAHQQGAFQQLAVVAPPAFLGLLRAALPKSLHGIVTEEIAKDLVREPVSALRAHLTEKSLGMATHRP